MLVMVVVASMLMVMMIIIMTVFCAVHSLNRTVESWQG